MKKFFLNKLISALIVFTLMIGVTGELNAEVAYGKSEDDYSVAMQLMKIIGVVNPELMVDETASVSREDAALYIAKLLNMEESDITQRYFIDVPADSYGTWAINSLTEMGIFSLNDNRCFYPQNNVTSDEMCKILTTVLGYGRYAEANGGYPMGYRMAAKRAGLKIPEGELSFSEFMTVLFDASQSEIYEVTAINAESVSMDYTGETILSLYHDIKVSEGTVSSVNGITSSLDETTEQGKAIIDGEHYNLDCDIYAPDFVASYVKYFYSDGTDKRETIKLMYREENEDTQISIYDVISISEREMTYWEKGRKVQIDFPSEILVYNGRVLEKSVAETLKALNKGNIIIRDSDDDGIEDAVIIWDYKNFVVNSVNERTGIIHNKIKNGQIIDETKYDSVQIYDEKRNALDISDIISGNVLSVAESKDGNVITVVVSANEFNGSISRINVNPDRISVNGAEYEIEPSYVSEYKKLNLKTKYTGKFYTDAFGFIAYIDDALAEGGMKYAYIIDSTLVEDGFDSEIKVKLINQDNVIETLSFSEKIRIDGERYDKKDQIINAFPKDVSSLDLISKQIIRYAVNSEGEINSVDTIRFNEQYETLENSLSLRGEDGYVAKWYRAERMGSQALVNGGNTKYFAVPKTPITEGDESEYAVGLLGDFWGDNTAVSCNIYVSNVKSAYADVLVEMYEYANLPGNQPTSGAMTVMVDEITENVDSEGNTVNCVVGISASGPVSVDVPDVIELDGIEQGDIIRFNKGARNQIVPSYNEGVIPDIITIYDYSAYMGADPGAWPTSSEFVHGYAQEKIDGALWLSSGGYGNYSQIIPPNTYVIVYDKDAREGQKVYAGDYDDIYDYITYGNECSSAILKLTRGACTALFVYI